MYTLKIVLKIIIFNITLFHKVLDIENLLGVEDTGIFRGVQTTGNYLHISFPFGGVTGSPSFAMPLFSVFKLLQISKEPLSQAWLSELPRLFPVYPPCWPLALLHLLFLVPFLLIHCLPRILSLFTPGFRNPLVLMPLLFKVTPFLHILAYRCMTSMSLRLSWQVCRWPNSSSLAGLSGTHTQSFCPISPSHRFFRVLWFSPLLKNQFVQIPIRPGIR